MEVGFVAACCADRGRAAAGAAAGAEDAAADGAAAEDAAEDAAGAEGCFLGLEWPLRLGMPLEWGTVLIPATTDKGTSSESSSSDPLDTGSIKVCCRSAVGVLSVLSVLRK